MSVFDGFPVYLRYNITNFYTGLIRRISLEYIRYQGPALVLMIQVFSDIVGNILNGDSHPAARDFALCFQVR